MTRKEEHSLFADYAQRHSVPSFIRDASYGHYKQQCAVVIDDFMTRNGRDPTSAEEDLLCLILRRSDSIEDCFNRTQAAYAAERNRDIDTFSKGADVSNFWSSVLSSAVGSLMYSILLVIMFYLAKDQIKTWLESLGSK